MKKVMGLVFRPLPEFKAWIDYVQSSSSTGQMDTNEQSGIDTNFLSLDSPIVVMQWDENSQRFTDFLYNQAEIILNAVLNKWCSNRKLWPDSLDINTLMTFFGLDMYTRITDMGLGQLKLANLREGSIADAHRYAAAVTLRESDSLKTWLKKVFVRSNRSADEIEKLNFNLFKEDGGLYLFPESVNNYDEAVTFLHQNYQTIFEKELTLFTPEKKFWPEELKFPLYGQWFETELRSTILF